MITKRTLFILTFLVFSFGAFAQIQFEKHQIGTSTTPFDVFIVDLDKDGRQDILTASNSNGGEIRWWRNNANQNFTQQAIATQITNPRSVRAGDIDLDGDIDIIAAILRRDEIYWWENDGSNNFTLHVLSDDFKGAHTVELCDLDLDGDIDVLCSGFDNSAAMSDVAWWENDGDQNWTKHIVSSRFNQSPFVFGADLDNDGDVDLAACGEVNGEIYWWENDGNMGWTEKLIDNAITMIHTILPRDFDKDGDLDILAHACVSGLQAWYENDGLGNYTKHAMENLGGAIWLEQADFDLDGDNDLIGTGMGAPSLICYENNGNQQLTGQWADGGLTSGFALNVADMDGDHDMDVVAIGYNSNSLAWWENISTKALALNGPKWLSRNPEDESIFISNEEVGDIAKAEASGFDHIIRNDFPVCTSTCVINDILWVNVATEIIGLDPKTGAKLNSFRLGAQFLAGLTTDNQGFLFATDPASGNIFKINPADGTIITHTTGLIFPQDIIYDSHLEKLLVLDGDGDIVIKVIDPSTGAISSEIETLIKSGGTIISDGNGNHYISSPDENAIYALTNSLSDEPVIYFEGLNQPHGMIYFADSQELLVANTGENNLQIIEAHASALNNEFSLNQTLQIFPNPFIDQLEFILPESSGKDADLMITSSTGKLVWKDNLDNNNSRTSYKLSLSKAGINKLPDGTYFLTWTDGSKRISKSILKIK